MPPKKFFGKKPRRKRLSYPKHLQPSTKDSNTNNNNTHTPTPVQTPTVTPDDRIQRNKTRNSSRSDNLIEEIDISANNYKLNQIIVNYSKTNKNEFKYKFNLRNRNN